MNNIIGIYKIINKFNNKIYIGSSINIRKRINRHFNDYLQNAWNKYGEEIFTYEVLEIIYNVNDLMDREQHFIDINNASNIKFGYNL